jgi:hypothetical protein
MNDPRVDDLCTMIRKIENEPWTVKNAATMAFTLAALRKQIRKELGMIEKVEQEHIKVDKSNYVDYNDYDTTPKWVTDNTYGSVDDIYKEEDEENE